MRYLLSNENATSDIDDDGYEIGVNGTVGGFSSVYITKQNMTVRFHDQNGTVMYTSSVPPRNLDNTGGTSKKLDPEYVIIISVSAVAFALLVLLALYYAVYKPRMLRRWRSAEQESEERVDELKQQASGSAGTPLLVEEVVWT